MKKLFAAIVLMPLLLNGQTANFNRLFVGGATEGGTTPPAPSESCTNLMYSWHNDVAGVGIAGYATSLYYASRFTATNSGTVCSIKVNLEVTGTPTGLIRAGIYTANIGGGPNALIGWSDNMDVPTVNSTVTFTNFSGVALVASTDYYVVLARNTFSNTDFLVWLSDTDGNAFDGNYYSGDGSTWTGEYPTRRQQVEIYE